MIFYKMEEGEPVIQTSESSPAPQISLATDAGNSNEPGALFWIFLFSLSLFFFSPSLLLTPVIKSEM